MRFAQFVVGHAVRTANDAESVEASALIPALWARATLNERLLRWSSRKGNARYAAYLDYEPDATGAYTLVVGGGSDNIAGLPSGLVAVRIPESGFGRFEGTGGGPLILLPQWQQVWEVYPIADARIFDTDLEIHYPHGAAELLVGLN